MENAHVKAAEAVARREITERDEAKRKIDRLPVEALASQIRAIEHLALGSSLRELLQHLCLAVETGSTDIRASVLILEAGRLRHAMAPSLPEDYCRAIDGLEIGPAVGSCGTAAFRGEQVVVSDIAVDPLWENYRSLALNHELAACWSTPILSRSGDVLGTFAIYGRHPQTPPEEELRQSEAFSRIAAVAIEREQAEEKIRALNDTLRRTNESLENRARQLQASLREMEAFSYTLAHDLRAPLRSMAGYSQLLLSKIPDGIPDEELRTYLGAISTSASRMDRLILDLLEYNGLARSPASLAIVDADLVLSQVLGSMAEEIRTCSAEIVRKGPVPPILGQQTLLASVLSNLLSNAIKFVAPGVIPRVHLRAEKREGMVRLWVEDNGIGIAPEYHARIFGVFERLNRMEDYPGTGMGLAIVARAVERMGGRVGVDSERARGSRFWIELADPQATPAA